MAREAVVTVAWKIDNSQSIERARAIAQAWNDLADALEKIQDETS